MRVRLQVAGSPSPCTSMIRRAAHGFRGAWLSAKNHVMLEYDARKVDMNVPKEYGTRRASKTVEEVRLEISAATFREFALPSPTAAQLRVQETLAQHHPDQALLSASRRAHSGIV